MPYCQAYRVRARGSERSRHMRGGFVLWFIEKVAMLGLRLGSGWTAGTGSPLVVRCALLCW